MYKLLVKETTLTEIQSCLADGDITDAAELLDAVIDSAPVLAPEQAAAPELLASLNEALDEVDADYAKGISEPPWAANARAAIAKATA